NEGQPAPRPQTVPEGQQDHGCVAMAPAVVLGRLYQPLDLALGQVLAGAVGSVRLSDGQSNCAFFGGRTDHFEVLNCRHFPPPDWMTANISCLLQPVDQEKLPAR